MNHDEASPLSLIRQVVSEYSDTAPELVVPEASLESLNVDSLTLAEMLFALEDRLDVSMPEPTSRPQTVADLIKLMEPYADLIRAKAVTA